MTVQQATDDTKPPLAAALMLLGRDVLPDWRGWPATVAEVLALAKAGKTQAYEMLGRLREILPTLEGRPGRPTFSTPPVEAQEVLSATLDFLMDHAGAVCGQGERRIYSDGFRRFVIDLTAPGRPGAGLAIAALAENTRIPLGTLKDWLRMPDTQPTPEPEARPPQTADTTPDRNPDPPPDPALEPPQEPTQPADIPTGPTPPAPLAMLARGPHIQTILAVWQQWEGPFQAFCDTLRTEYRIPYGDTYIGTILNAACLRYRQPRRPVEAPWSHDTFRTLFPGAQWLGDGTTLAFWWNDRCFVFNVEPITDPASDAIVGFSVTDTEDEQAVIEAFNLGIATTGAHPVAITLDNRPSNHSPAVVAAIAPTIPIRSTLGRGQAKAHVEGAHGLFEQSLPPLVIAGPNDRERARSALILIFTTWARGRNGKPRKRLGGLSPRDFYFANQPTPEELQEARDWAQELIRRQELARQTRAARADPVRRDLLIRGLAELGIPDPNHRLACDLAYYGRDAIAAGLATFESKRDQGTIPPGADPGRYLAGIIRNLDEQFELDSFALHILKQRIRLKDFSLAPLTAYADEIRAALPRADQPQAFIDRALDAQYTIDFRFWSGTAANALEALPAPTAAALYPFLAKRVAASFSTDQTRRADLIDAMAKVVAGAA